MRNLGLLGCVGALILALIIGGAYFVSVRNNIVGLDEQVQQHWAQVESQYQRRYDLIPNLVRTVQGAANFEKSTLEAVVNARASARWRLRPDLPARPRPLPTTRTRWINSRPRSRASATRCRDCWSSWSAIPI